MAFVLFGGFFGFIIFPWLKFHFGQTLYFEPAEPWYYLLFLSNFNTLYVGSNTPTLTLLWSVAVEEQFYLLWPILIGFTPKRYTVWVFIFIVAASGLFRFMHLEDDKILHFHTLSVISDMAVGGGFAWLAYTQPAFIQNIFMWPRWLIVLIYIIGIIFIYNRFNLHIWPPYMAFDRIILSLFFSFVILEQNFAKNSLFKFSSLHFSTFWGKYTYGLYCWHFLGLLIAYQILHKIGLEDNIWGVVLGENIIGILLSFGISWISYHFYEKHFLKWKDRFAYVVRG